jgi:hypothetical protein
MHTIGPGIFERKKKNVEKETQTLHDLEDGMKTEKRGK